jgi:hypothetical protein
MRRPPAAAHVISETFCWTQNCPPVTDDNENRTNVPPSQRSRQSFFISIVVVVQVVTVAIVIDAVAGPALFFNNRSECSFGTDH